VGGGGTGSKVVFGVEGVLSSVHFPLAQWTFDFVCNVVFGGWGAGVGAHSNQRVPIAPHFYPMCLSKCYPPFTYIAEPKGRNSIFQNRTFYFGMPPWFFFFE
jgi:hypothetical protein